MEGIKDGDGREGILFFEELTAAVSHELRNALAVINESGGLLEDFSFMLEGGRAIAPERLRSVAARITRQVERASVILQEISQAAHSSGPSRSRLEVTAVTRRMILLAGRMAANAGIRWTLEAADEALWVEADGLTLQHLLWCCLKAISQADGPEREIPIQVARSGAQVSIRLGPRAGTADPEAFLPGALRNAAGGMAVHAPQSGGLVILLNT